LKSRARLAAVAPFFTGLKKKKPLEVSSVLSLSSSQAHSTMSIRRNERMYSPSSFVTR